jgi:hypothetical protein
MVTTKSKLGMGWPEWVAIVALVAAAVSLIGFGAILSTTAFLLVAVMGHTRAFEENAANGKPTLKGPGRAAVGGMMAVLGFAMLPTSQEPPSSAEQTAETSTSNAQPAKLTPAEAEAKSVADQALERTNQAKIASHIADEKKLRERDYEGRLGFWMEITEMAPGNPEYARKRDELETKLAELEDAIQNPEQAGASVEKVAARKAGFGNVLMIDVTLRNDSLSNLKDFQITCESRGNSGTVMDSNTRTLYEIVEARSSRAFRNVNMGLLRSQAASSNCVVDRAAVA